MLEPCIVKNRGHFFLFSHKVFLPVGDLGLEQEKLWDAEEAWEDTDRENVSKKGPLVPEVAPGDGEVVLGADAEHAVDTA